MPLSGWRYAYDLVDNRGTSLQNFVVKVPLNSAFNFALAKSDGSDVRIYDETIGSSCPYWLFDYDSVAQTGYIYYKAFNSSHQHRVFFGNNSANSASSFSGVFYHGAGFDAAAPLGDLSTTTANSGTVTRYGNPTGVADPQNYRFWRINDTPMMALSDMTNAGIAQGSYSGIREFCLIQDVSNKIISVTGLYHAFFARRPIVSTDPLDAWTATSVSQYGPWSNFSKVYSPPSDQHLGYSSCCLFVTGVYHLFLTQGWGSGGGTSPSLSVWKITSTNLSTWSSARLVCSGAIFNDFLGGPVDNIGNPWVIKCNDGQYMMVVEGNLNGAGGRWQCFGATSSDLLNWAPLNTGVALILPTSADTYAWDWYGAANPKCMQLSDNSYIIQYNGSNNNVDPNWQVGFAASPNRNGPYTKLSTNPSIARSSGTYGLETSAFCYDTDGKSFYNIVQRYQDASYSPEIYLTHAETKQGCSLVTRDESGAAAMGCVLNSGSWTIETRSVLTAEATSPRVGAGGSSIIDILSIMNTGSFPPAASTSNFNAQRVVEIIRQSFERPIRGAITLTYFTPSSVRTTWNSGTLSWDIGFNPIDTEYGREITATLSDDGTNYIFNIVYSDNNQQILPVSPRIAKASVLPITNHAVFHVGDLFTDNNMNGAYFRYASVRPYAAIEPAMSLNAFHDFNSQVIFSGLVNAVFYKTGSQYHFGFST